MKVLQVNCVYKKGSTGAIVYDLHTQLQAAGVDSVVCYGRGEKTKEQGVYKVCPEWYSKLNNLITRFTGLMYGGCFFSTWNLLRVIRKEKPDIVHLHCINGYFVNIYRLVRKLKELRIPTVVTNHAEFLYTANCGHAHDCPKWQTGCGHCPRLRRETGSLLFDGTKRSWKKMQRAFAQSEDRFFVTSVSPWLQKRAKQSPMLKEHRHTVVYNGVDTEVFYPRPEETKYREAGKKLVLHVTARFGDPNKGGKYLLELAHRLGEEYRILLVGNGLPSKAPENVLCLGAIQDREELAKLYAACDVTVITSKKETFSMICAESLCCGTPVVGFLAGGPEDISLPEYSAFCEHADVQTLEQLVRRWAERPKEDACWQKAHKVYSKQKMTEDYMAVYGELLQSLGGIQ